MVNFKIEVINRKAPLGSINTKTTILQYINNLEDGWGEK